MIATIVHVWVQPAYIQEFIEACRINHENSVLEKGNLCFDILQDSNNSAKFTLIEAYESEEAALAHKETSHYKIWRDTVAPWMVKPRESVKHTILNFTKRP